VEWFEVLLLGIVEGFTEFLPISSTGHLIMASYVLGIAQTDFHKTFTIAIQFGAILAVVAVFWRKFLDIHMLARLCVAFVPTGVLGFLFYKTIKTYLLGNEVVVLAALFLGGILLLIFEWWYVEKEGALDDVRHLSYAKAAILGVCQAAAMIPGVSRSAATIAGGLFLGMRRTAIVEFSFLLAVPTMLVASCFALFKDPPAIVWDELGVLGLGFGAAFLTALISIVWLLRFIRTHTFVPFALYRIAIAIVFAWVLWG